MVDLLFTHLTTSAHMSWIPTWLELEHFGILCGDPMQREGGRNKSRAASGAWIMMWSQSVFWGNISLYLQPPPPLVYSAHRCTHTSRWWQSNWLGIAPYRTSQIWIPKVLVKQRFSIEYTYHNYRVVYTSLGAVRTPLSTFNEFVTIHSKQLNVAMCSHMEL